MSSTTICVLTQPHLAHRHHAGSSKAFEYIDQPGKPQSSWIAQRQDAYITVCISMSRQGQQRFTPERVYSRDSLHQTAFTPDTVYTRQKGLTADEVYTRQNRQRFTPERVYSRDSLHQTAFTPDTVYTRRRLHQTKPTKVYTRKSLHHRQFTPDSVYTRHRLHQTWFTPDMVETIAAAIIRRLATKDCKTPRNYALNDDTGTPSSQNYKANSNQSV